jgi:radical SAM-linked protein
MRTERGEFLVKLDALVRKAEPAPQPPAAGPASSPAPTAESLESPQPPAAERPHKPKRKYRAPPARPDQGTPIRLRLAYRKLGRAAYSSHLDLVRMLPRLFRRLDLPVYYSLGFHSKPVLLFGPALSLGVASLGEYIDIKLAAAASTRWEELPTRLNEGSVDGLEFFGARLLAPADAKLSQVIQEAEYVAALPGSALAVLGLRDQDELAARIADRARGELRVRRNVEGLGKIIDVKRYLLAADVGCGEAALHEAGLVGDLIPVRIRLAFTDDGTAKVSEALEGLIGQAELPVRYVRSALGWRAGQQTGGPLEIERLRDVQSVASLAKLAASPSEAAAL